MKKITMFYLTGCPYCRQAFQAIRELKESEPTYKNVEIIEIEETQNPDIVAKYDYYYVPSMFIDGQKVYEAKPGESYTDCKASVRAAFEEAIA